MLNIFNKNTTHFAFNSYDSRARSEEGPGCINRNQPPPPRSRQPSPWGWAIPSCRPSPPSPHKEQSGESTNRLEGLDCLEKNGAGSQARRALAQRDHRCPVCRMVAGCCLTTWEKCAKAFGQR